MQNKKINLDHIEKLLSENKTDQAKKELNKLRLPEVTHLAVLATICMKEGDLQQAEVLFLRALQADPGNVLALGNLAQLYVGQKKYTTALPYAEKSYEAVKKNLNYALNYAACLSESDQCKKAVELIQPFLDPKKPDRKILLAVVSLLRADLRSNEAVDLLNEYEIHFKDDPEYLRALGETYTELDPRIASKHFAEAVQHLPDNLQLQWNWSFVELRLRNFEKGWNLYESGLTDKIGKVGRPLPSQVKLIPTVTHVEDLDPTKWTLFTTEQGIGDQILFLGCLRDVLKQYPKSVLIGEERMLPLLKRSFPEIGAYTYGFVNVLAKQKELINGVFPIGSLQKYYRKSVDDFINHRAPYVLPNVEAAAKYRDAIQKKVPGKKLIGISWRGGYWDRQVRTKSFEFELFSQLMQQSNCQFVSLQYGDVSKERAYVKEKSLPVTFVDGFDFKRDIDSWVALGAACDEILSVSTALVHFMGGMGKKVNLLLSDYQSPFIWGLEDGVSLPYESVFIHRKKKDEAIADYFDRVRKVIT